MISSVTLNLSIPPELTAKLAERAAENGVSSDVMAARIILEAVAAIEEAGESPPDSGQPPPGPTPVGEKDVCTVCPQASGPDASPPAAGRECLDIARILTTKERRRLDDLAIRHGASPEALAAATVRRLLKRAGAAPQTFRLKMPEQAKRKLQEHASALGCRAGELAAFLFSKRKSRAQAEMA